MSPKLSVIITSFNEGVNLDRLFHDLSKQDFDKNAYEILFLEAGNDSKKRALEKLGDSCVLLKYWHIPKLSRTAALNFLVKESAGDLIVRLDARTHIESDYLSRIYALSLRENVANVGGVQIPVGRSDEQRIIASIMLHPVGMGGAKYRSVSYKGEVDSVYLGAFCRKQMPNEPWFDEELPKISEDSDLNLRIRKSGGKVHLDSSIAVWHYPRESLKPFFKLCFNYGFGRALFVMKNKQFSAPRQIILPFLAIFGLFFYTLGFAFPVAHTILAYAFLFYMAAILFISFRNQLGDLRRGLLTFFGFSGCHFFWTLGFFCGLIDYLFLRLKKLFL